MEVSQDEIRELRDLYKKAEDAIHSLGITGSGVDTAAVNELRYAGNHLLRALTTDSKAEADDQMVRATRHCQRALYDAYDGAIYYQLDQFKVFRNDYRTVVITEVVSDYLDIATRMNAARDTLEEARRSTSDRSAYYAKVEERYGSMAADMDRLSAAREELNKKIVEKSVSFTRWAVNALIAIAGVAAGAIVTYFRMKA